MVKGLSDRSTETQPGSVRPAKRQPYRGPLFRVREVADLLDVRPRRVEGWVEQGLLRPTVKGKGPGRRNLFTLSHVLQGAALLAVQENFGEKSPLTTRLFPDIAETFATFEQNRSGREVVLAVALARGDVKTLGVASHPGPNLDRFINAHASHGYAVVVLNMSSVLAPINQRLRRYMLNQQLPSKPIVEKMPPELSPELRRRLSALGGVEPP